MRMCVDILKQNNDKTNTRRDTIIMFCYAILKYKIQNKQLYGSFANSNKFILMSKF